jgi:hypothetical protein
MADPRRGAAAGDSEGENLEKLPAIELSVSVPAKAIKADIRRQKSADVAFNVPAVEIPRGEAGSKFVMPANAGIQVRFRFEFQKRLYSGLRRNDGNMSQLPVDNADPFGLKSKLVQFHPAGIQSLCC